MLSIKCVLTGIDYQIKPEANSASPDTSTWPLLLKVCFLHLKSFAKTP